MGFNSVFKGLSHATVDRHFGAATVPEGACGPWPFFALYPSIRLTTEQKSYKNLSHGSRKASSWIALVTICCVDLVTALLAASTSLLASVPPNVSFRRPGSTRASGSICQVAELSISLHQLTLSWHSRLELPKLILNKINILRSSSIENIQRCWRRTVDHSLMKYTVQGGDVQISDF